MTAGPIVRIGEVDPGGSALKRFGVLGAALSRAALAGLPVVETWVLEASLFRRMETERLPRGHEVSALIRAVHRSRGVLRAAAAFESVRRRRLELSEWQDLRELWLRLAPRAPRGVVVRASPTTTGVRTADLAGLSQVLVGVTGVDELERAVRELWASCFHEQALRQLRAQRVRSCAMAILFQPVGDLTATAHLLKDAPQSSRSGTQGGQAVLGKGAALSFTKGARGVGSRSARVIEGCAAALPGNTEGTADPHVAPCERAALSGLVEGLLGTQGPLAAEIWCDGHVPRLGVQSWFGDEVLVAGGRADSRWCLGLVGECLVGPCSRLSASLYESWGPNWGAFALDVLGCKPADDQTLVSRVQGRLCWNAGAVAEGLGDFPGGALGVSEELAGEAFGLADARRLSPSGSASLLDATRTARRLTLASRRLESALAQIEHDTEATRTWLNEMDLGILPDDALCTTLQRSHDLMRDAQALHAASSLSGAVTRAVLWSILREAGVTHALRVIDGATVLSSEITSAAPALALAQLFGSEAARSVVGSDRPRGFRVALDPILRAYGTRGVGELDPRTPRWSEHPGFLRDVLRAGLLRPVDAEARLGEVRSQARAGMRAVEKELSLLTRMLSRSAFGRLAVLENLRERSRYWLAASVGLLRMVVQDVDRRLQRIDPSLKQGAAFFLSFEELVSAIGMSRRDLGAVVRMRRAGLRRARRTADPPQRFDGGPPTWPAPACARELSATPCSAGRVTGRLRFVTESGRGVRDMEEGDILVIRSLDLGYAPAFLLARGVVAGWGSPLSAAGQVLRQFGVSAVTNLGLARFRGKPGDLVELDGDAGTISVLS